MNIDNEKINNLLKIKKFPTRALLSGKGNLIDLAVKIAANLQEISREKIESGIHADTIVFRDNGKSFKIDWSESAEKDGQSEQENVRGMIKLAHQKPLAPYRIIILENIERVGREASYAMLKLIEEPAEKVVFIFTTKNHHKLLDTILSRLTVINIVNEDEDFEISEEISEFLNSRNLIKKFKIIEKLDNESRENSSNSIKFSEKRATNRINSNKNKKQSTNSKKIDRTIFLKFIEELIAVSRVLPKYQNHLEILLETHNAITSNISPKFAMERLAIKITQQ